MRRALGLFGIAHCRSAVVLVAVILASHPTFPDKDFPTTNSCLLSLEDCVDACKDALERKEWERAERLAILLAGIGSKETERRDSGGLHTIEWYPHYWRAKALVGQRRWDDAESALRQAMERPERVFLQTEIDKGRAEDEDKATTERAKADRAKSDEVEAIAAKEAQAKRSEAPGGLEPDITERRNDAPRLPPQPTEMPIAGAEETREIEESDAVRQQEKRYADLLANIESLAKRNPNEALRRLEIAVKEAPSGSRRELVDAMKKLCKGWWSEGKRLNRERKLRDSERELDLARRAASGLAELPGEEREYEVVAQRLQEQIFAIRLKLAIDAAHQGSGREIAPDLLSSLKKPPRGLNVDLRHLARIVVWAAERDGGRKPPVPDDSMKEFAAKNIPLVRGSISGEAFKALGL